jgi:hypothetical protein
VHGKEKRITEDFAAAVAATGRAAGAFVGGAPEPYASRWAHGPHVTIFRLWGDHEHGWDEVGPRLDWAARLFVGPDRAAPHRGGLQRRPGVLAELDAKRADLQQTLLLISGALQVLTELLDAEPPTSDGGTSATRPGS